MNRINNWQDLLAFANDDLAKYGMKLQTECDDDGYYSLYINDNGNRVTCFAENYFEDELSALVNDAWAHARAAGERRMKKREKVIYIITRDEVDNVYTIPHTPLAYEKYEDAKKKFEEIAEYVRELGNGDGWTLEEHGEEQDGPISCEAWDDGCWDKSHYGLYLTPVRLQ